MGLGVQAFCRVMGLGSSLHAVGVCLGFRGSVVWD